MRNPHFAPSSADAVVLTFGGRPHVAPYPNTLQI